MKRTILAIVIGAICAGTSVGVLANNADSNDSQAAQQEGTTAGQLRSIDDTASQSQQSGNDDSQQQSSEGGNSSSTETQSPPQDSEGNDLDRQDQEAIDSSDRQDEQGGQPEVTVEQADETQVDVNNDDEQEHQRANQDNPNGQNNSLMTQRVSDLEGMTVVNQEDEEIGDIQHIAQHNDSGDLYAIISVGGIWGFGATDIALPVDEMQLGNDQLVMNTDYGSDQIEESSEGYNEDSYTQVDSEMALSEAQQQQ